MDACVWARGAGGIFIGGGQWWTGGTRLSAGAAHYSPSSARFITSRVPLRPESAIFRPFRPGSLKKPDNSSRNIDRGCGRTRGVHSKSDLVCFYCPSWMSGQLIIESLPDIMTVTSDPRCSSRRVEVHSLPTLTDFPVMRGLGG